MNTVQEILALPPLPRILLQVLLGLPAIFLLVVDAYIYTKLRLRGWWVTTSELAVLLLIAPLGLLWFALGSASVAISLYVSHALDGNGNVFLSILYYVIACVVYVGAIVLMIRLVRNRAQLVQAQTKLAAEKKENESMWN